jgi:hypothetical protein
MSPTTYSTRTVPTTSYSERPWIGFIMTEALDFLMTEDDDYLITDESIYSSYSVRTPI